MTDQRVLPGLCAEHGGLMWSNAMRACITPDDVIRGPCRWEPLPMEVMGLTKDRASFDGGMTWEDVWTE